MGGSRLSSAERRKEIIEVALKIIYERGYSDLTIRNIAEEIGISEAAIYRHFKSKEDIVKSLAEIVFSCNSLQDYDFSRKDPFELLRNIMLNQFKILKENPYLTAILFHEDIFRGYSVIREKFDRHREGNEELLKSIVKEGQKRGIFTEDVEPEVFAVLYMGSMRVSVFKWRRADFSYDLEQEGEKILEHLFRLLRN